MPRIKAPTVKEHRLEQKKLLLDCSRKIILSEGLSGLSFDVLAIKAKISRPAVYEYFKTKDDLIREIILLEFSKWEEDLIKVIEAVEDPIDVIQIFVKTQLIWVKQGRHQIPFILSNSKLSDDLILEIHQLHKKIIHILSKKLSEIELKKK